MTPLSWAKRSWPEVESLDQLDQIVQIAASLRRFQPEQAQFVRQTLQDLLAGQTRSLVQRFEVPREAATRIREAFELDGIDGALIALQEELDRTGRSIENFADTADVRIAQAEARLNILRDIIGAPLTDSITSELGEIIELIDTNSDAFENFGGGFGVALADSVGSISDVIQILIDQFSNAQPVVTDTFATAALIVDQIAQLVGAAEDGADEVSTLFALVNGLLNAILTPLEKLNVFLGNVDIQVNRLITQVTNLRRFADGEISFGNLIDLNQEANIQAGEEFEELLGRVQRRREEITASINEYVDSLDREASAGEDAANAHLANAQALEAEAEAAENAASAREKLNEALDEFNIDIDRARADLEREQQQDILDLERDFAQKREDISTDFYDRQADISRDFFEGQQDLIEGFSRREEDILREAGRDRIDLENDIAQRAHQDRERPTGRA